MSFERITPAIKSPASAAAISTRFVNSPVAYTVLVAIKLDALGNVTICVSG